MSIDMDRDYEIQHVQYKGNCPSERAFHGSITFGNKILVYGGFDKEKELNDYFVFNSADNSWMSTTLIDNPSVRE